MITAGIINVVIILLSIPLGIATVAADSFIPDFVLTWLSTGVTYSYVFDPIVPISLMWTLFSSALGFELTIIAYKSGMWLFDIIRHAVRG